MGIAPNPRTMFAKLMTLTVFAVVLGGTLLALRQERLDLAHDVVTARAHARQLEQEVWAAQAQAAAVTTPDRIERHIQHTQLALEPAVPRFGGEADSRVVQVHDPSQGEGP